ncbi:MAG: hypothetical protein V4649_19900 [Bacteroidota bacterium]
MNAADKYFLKAKEKYPYEVDDALESLDYGLSHDGDHAGLLTMKGNIYYEDLKQFDAARECYELALINDNAYVEAYYGYIRFTLTMSDYARAERLVIAALQVKGIDLATIYYYEALLREKQQSFGKAVKSLAKAREHCTVKKTYSFYEEEAERIEQKSRDVKKKC